MAQYFKNFICAKIQKYINYDSFSKKSSGQLQKNAKKSPTSGVYKM
jgi:hypothetical protein